MSPVHGNQGQPYARPVTPNQTQNQWGQQTQPAPAQNPYPQQGYANGAAYAGQQGQYGGYAQQPAASGQTAADEYGYPNGAPAGYGVNPQANGNYAPQFEPYVPAPQPRAVQHPQNYAGGYQQAVPPQQHTQAPPTYGQQPSPFGGAPSYQPNNAAQTWGAPQDNRGFDLGTYMPSVQPHHANAVDPATTDWGLGGYHGETGGYEHADQGHAEAGFAQAAGGELDQGYAEDEGQEYELEEPSRIRRPAMIVAVLAGAIAIGGGLSLAYKSVLGGSAGGDPPVVKSATAPSKVKPEEGGGKQFSHADSKIMGRLGDGSGAPAAAASEVDANGTRKVSTLVVGRDGSIQPPAPAAASEDPSGGSVAVPGMTVVDGLGPAKAPAAAATMAAVNPPPAKAEPQKVAAVEPPPAKIVVSPSTSPAPQKPVTIAKAPTAPAPAPTTASIESAAGEAPVAPAPAPPAKKAKAPAPVSNSVATTGNGANGFVAVLASVPRSSSSRMDALKRFADMQQKYSTVLAGKTPDVAEADLGAKGAYHRLVVGPPGSREQASTVCSQLKSQGYADCWVTSY